ncbi:protein of unknown function [Methylocaldum szegediense]|uniref:Uncharacterized protein n=1 Tax=Methylocaldum szegediense TaxID=73780 RepID=A0ABM9I427_9GAMM|nr:protein of unknown function [Methylocaldum szegediense]
MAEVEAPSNRETIADRGGPMGVSAKALDPDKAVFAVSE